MELKEIQEYVKKQLSEKMLDKMESVLDEYKDEIEKNKRF